MCDVGSAERFEATGLVLTLPKEPDETESLF